MDKVRAYLRVWMGQVCTESSARRHPRLCELLRAVDRVPAGAGAALRRELAAQIEAVTSAMQKHMHGGGSSPGDRGVLDICAMRLLRSHRAVEGLYMLSVVIGCVCIAFQVGKILYTRDAKSISLSFTILYFLSLSLRIPYFVLFCSSTSFWYIFTSALLVALLVAVTAWYHRRDSAKDEPEEDRSHG